MASIFSWHRGNWEKLLSRREQSRFPHALFLTGAQGTGKRQFALALAQSLLCKQPDVKHQACGVCDSCQLLQADTHPDFHLLEPEESGKAIRIDSIRTLINKLVNLKSHFQGGNKVAIIHPAEAMNTASANSLLKTLEEPPANTIIILVGNKPSSLPATIRSRCQMLRLTSPSAEQALTWLEQQLGDEQRSQRLLNMSANAPLTALTMAEQDYDEAYAQMRQEWIALARGQSDPVKVAEKWLKTDQNMPLQWTYEWIAQLIRLKQLGHPVTGDSPADFDSLVQVITLKQLYELYDQASEAIKVLHTQANHLMLLEGILLYWSNLARHKA